VAQKDWGWKPQFDLDEVVREMLEHLQGINVGMKL
jgi:hypothetical protein